MLTCDICGRAIPDTADENMAYGMVPYPFDISITGICRDCGGDPKAKATRRQMGWAMCAFVDARLPALAARLSESSRRKLLAMPYAKQADVICRMVERGLMI